MTARGALASLLFAGALGASRPALAWNAGISSSAAGLSTCTVPFDDEPTAQQLTMVRQNPRPRARVPRLRLGAGYVRSTPVLQIDEQRDARPTLEIATVRLEVRATDRLSLLFALGAFGVGDVRIDRERARGDLFVPFAVSLAASYRLTTFSYAHPFVLATAGLGLVVASRGEPDRPDPRARSFNGYDLRAGLTVGQTLARVFTPYVAARLVAGAVFTRHEGIDRALSDRAHYQVALGATLTLGGGFLQVFVEAAPLGEGGFALGAAAQL